MNGNARSNFQKGESDENYTSDSRCCIDVLLGVVGLGVAAEPGNFDLWLWNPSECGQLHGVGMHGSRRRISVDRRTYLSAGHVVHRGDSQAQLHTGRVWQP